LRDAQEAGQGLGQGPVEVAEQNDKGGGEQGSNDEGVDGDA